MSTAALVWFLVVAGQGRDGVVVFPGSFATKLECEQTAGQIEAASAAKRERGMGLLYGICIARDKAAL